MPLLSLIPSQNDALTSALGEAGELEYVQLVSMLEHTQGIFALMLVRSNFTPALRDSLLERLAADLDPAPLSIVRAMETQFNVAQMLSEAAQSISSTGVLALVGLEDTPYMAVEGGREMRRPPALASLNHGREALRRACSMPIVVWCSDWVYTTLREHAPDFFDHFTGLFSFCASNNYVSTKTLEATRQIEEPRTRYGDNAGMRAALKFYEHEISKHTAPTKERAHTLLGIAEALWAITEGDQEKQLSRAYSVALEALNLLSLEQHSNEWGRCHNVLGNILSIMPTGNRSENLRRAMHHYQIALQTFDKVDHPQGWAAATYNIGMVYYHLSEGDKSENLEYAISYFNNAANVEARNGSMLMWASIQNMIGNAYTQLETGDHSDNLNQAVRHYESALTVFDEHNYPQDWAVTQNNLGMAHNSYANDESEQHAYVAVSCFQAALRVLTETQYPQDWAIIQQNLGIALYKLGNISKAHHAWLQAVRVFRSIGLEEEAQEVESWINSLPKDEVDEPT